MSPSRVRPSAWAIFGVLLTSAGIEGCLWDCPGPVSGHSVVPVAKEPDEFEFAKLCSEACHGIRPQCTRGKTENGTPAVICDERLVEGCISGRRPRGYRRRGSLGASISDVLSTRAKLEAASVAAFDALAAELAAFGAPRGLVARAARSAREEERHARVVSALAVARGGRAAIPRAERARTGAGRAPRGLLAMAIENAREGCVFETFAALSARVESETATDATFRRHMRAIARDEARHADLARDVDAWIRPHLRPAERARLDRAHRAAWATLERSVARPAIPELGVPEPARRKQLVAALAAVLSP